MLRGGNSGRRPHSPRSRHWRGHHSGLLPQPPPLSRAGVRGIGLSRAKLLPVGPPQWNSSACGSASPQWGHCHMREHSAERVEARRPPACDHRCGTHARDIARPPGKPAIWLRTVMCSNQMYRGVCMYEPPLWDVDACLPVPSPVAQWPVGYVRPLVVGGSVGVVA